MSGRDRPQPQLFVRDGSSQDCRALAPLQDGYFSLAEMSFPVLLAMATEHARLVGFYQLDDRPDGSWKPFFSADETIVMARILAVRPQYEQARFDRWWATAGMAPDAAARARARVPTLRLARFLEGWRNDLAQARGSAGRKLHTLLAAVIGSLGADPHAQAALQAARLLNQQERPEPALADTPRERIKSSYDTLFTAIEMVQRETARLLPETLASGKHEPAVALLIAFIRMARQLHARLNRFTSGHLDFYYDGMLGTPPLPAVPDHCYLVVAPCPTGGSIAIAPGTEFLARPDADGRQAVYLADAGLLVGDASIGAMHTLYFNRDRNISPETDMDKRGSVAARQAWPSHVWSRQLPLPGQLDYTDPAALRALPLLGAPKNATEAGQAHDARLGFALASNVLLMREGRRRVKISLEFAPPHLKWRLLRLITVIRHKKMRSGNTVDRVELADICQRILRGLFRIEVTGPSGWIRVPAYHPSLPASGQGHATAGALLQIEFELGLEIAPVVAYAPALHGESYQTAVPMVRLRLNPDSYVYPYGLLRGLTLTAASIAVHVSGYRQLSLSNQIGQLSAATPFQPFGPIPVVGSYLIVGAGEAAGKDLRHFHVDLEWAELPDDAGGFKAYYHDYSDTVETEAYQARVEVLADGVWLPQESQAPLAPLFQTDYARTASRRVLRHIRLSCDGVLERMRRGAAPHAPGNGPYSAASRHGYFKFTLAAPRFAFGHREYAQALAHAMKRNLRNKSGRFLAGIPELPYTPLVAAITASYEAVARIALQQPGAAPAAGWNNTLFHLHPHGWEALSNATDGGATLLPVYEELGYLHIGLAASNQAAMLTLFFHLQEDSLPDAPRAVAWSYLSDNKWQPLPQRNILSDSTGGFMTSGMVALNIPSDISLQQTLMPAGLYWLRISGSDKLSNFCSVYTVYTQALCVRRDPVSMQSATQVSLPAASIERSRQVIAGLGKIAQIIATRGGQLAETRAQRHTRLAERLRHKGRAVTPADYESLILQQFPEIYKVKCFANLSTQGHTPAEWLRPGHILIVVVPPLAPGSALHHMPQLNGKLVREVEAWIRALAPPAATIAVQHPVYEQIQVRCSVTLKPGLADGLGGQYMTRLNEDISRFLSPWSALGNRIHFGWNVRLHEVESYIIGLDYIADVSACSMLRVAPTDRGSYVLSDTAADSRKQGIAWHYPWSVAIPIEKHLIDIHAHEGGSLQRANLHTLDIGATFIITSKATHGPA